MKIEQTKKMVMTALFCALSYVCLFVFRIEVVFLNFEAKDAVTAVFGMFFGPVAALTVAVLTAVLELLTISDTGFYGLAMNILSSAAFVLPVSFLYTRRRSLSVAVLGLASGVAVTTGAMMLFNLLVTPFYLGTDIAEVAALIPTLLLPFNLVKSLLNAGFVLLLYKPVSVALKSAGMVPKKQVSDSGMHFQKSTAVAAVGGLALVVGSVLFFLFVMHGKASFF